jgi:sugar lactone lactonase YvrE
MGSRLVLACLLSMLWAHSGQAGVEQDLIRPKYVAGPPAAEDMLLLPGTSWVIVSAVSIGPEAVPGLYAVSNTPPHLERLGFRTEPPREGGVCPAPLDDSGFSPLGIAWRDGQEQRELLVANRGERKAVEIFSVIDTSGGVPELTWQDCIPLPPHIVANSLAPHPDGSVLVTQSSDPRDEQAWAKRERGEVTGQVFQWRSSTDWVPVPGSALSGPNGLAVSLDGCYAVVAAWAERRLVRLPLDCASERSVSRASIGLSFMPDNLRWSSRGTILATGQLTTPEGLLTCVREGGPCPERVQVVEVDPVDLSAAKTWNLHAGDTLGLGTTALEVGDAVWVSSILGRVIGRFTIEAVSQ